jgi:hypothetical protein
MWTCEGDAIVATLAAHCFGFVAVVNLWLFTLICYFVLAQLLDVEM